MQNEPSMPPQGPPPAPQTPGQKPFSWQMILLGAMLLGMWFWQSAGEGRVHPSVAYTDFVTWAEQGQVSEVVLRGQKAEGMLRKSQTFNQREIQRFEVYLPREDVELLPLLKEKGVTLRVESEQQPFAVQLVLSLLPWALIIGVWIWLSRSTRKMMGSGGPFGMMGGKQKKFERVANVSVRFDDVAGLGPAKRDLEEVVQFLKEPEGFRRLGGKVPRGVLLVGPPGTGKTLLARAVAGESGVPFYSISASEFIEMFVGVGASRVRELFTQAKKNAPAIIFIDEIDAVGRARGAGVGGGHDEREQTLNQLLSEMDGFERNDLTVVLAATNRPDVLDPALLRPGRFDRRVVVERPELKARIAILNVHLRDKPLGEDVSVKGLAERTPGFSGADLANLTNEAALHATRRGADVVEDSDFLAAYDKIVLGDPREGKLTSVERERVAVHEAGHALVAHLSKDNAARLKRVSIIPRGMALGITEQTSDEERYLSTEPELIARIRVLMGGYSAERLVLGTTSSGASDDLKKATQIAGKMVSEFGMSPLLGPAHFEQQGEHPFLGMKTASEGITSQSTQATIEAEVRRILTSTQEKAMEMLTTHRSTLDRLTAALLEFETLEKEQLLGVLTPDGSHQS